MHSFADYEDEGAKWVTVLEDDYYPDYLEQAEERHREDLRKFQEIVQNADSSGGILKHLNNNWTTTGDEGKERRQLLRIFRLYVCPVTSVEMLKKKGNEEMVLNDFAEFIRPIEEVKEQIENRPFPDEALAAILDQYDDRGQKGYWVEEQVFQWFEENFGDDYNIEGPRGAGRDIYLNEELDGYPYETPVDFIVYGPTNEPEIVGFARYDSDRGGAQEDDRTGGNKNTVQNIIEYSDEYGYDIKALFVNEGPGLLLGSMWEDYAYTEEMAPNVKVCTLKMMDERISEDWVLSDPISESDEPVVKDEEEVQDQQGLGQFTE
jgi:hypothetical protein